ncbi:hypothetical protein XO12_07765 [Marinitoga sp. 1154]|nr:hypothetical protein [Marinitoga sp. 1154]
MVIIIYIEKDEHIYKFNFRNKIQIKKFYIKMKKLEPFYKPILCKSLNNRREKMSAVTAQIDILKDYKIKYKIYK